MDCKICGANNIQITGLPDFSSIPSNFIRHDYKVMQCKKCEFYFVSPEIDFTDFEWARLYNEEYFSEPTEWHKKERISSIRSRLNRLSGSSAHPVKRFLDAGCGEGLASINALSRGWQVYAFDISDNRSDEAKNSSIDFRRGNIFKAEYPENFFDVIYMDSVLEHVPNPLEYLKEMHRILAPGGVIYIGVPNEDSLFNDVRTLVNKITGNGITSKLKPFKSPYHICGFTDKALKTIAFNSSFKIVSLVNFAARFEFLKFRFGTSAYIQHLLLFPFDLAAMVIRKEVYYEAILKK